MINSWSVSAWSKHHRITAHRKTKCTMKTNVLCLLLLFVSIFYTLGYNCSDEYPAECAKFAAEGNCTGGGTHSAVVALRAVVDCRYVSIENFQCFWSNSYRSSCRQQFQNYDIFSQNQLITELGGFGDTIIDLLGQPLDICNLQDGLDRVLRYSILRHMLIGVRQPPWVPAFTKEGFRQDDIPGHLMGIMKIARMKSETFIEPCIPDVAALNCQVL